MNDSIQMKIMSTFLIPSPTVVDHVVVSNMRMKEIISN